MAAAVARPRRVPARDRGSEALAPTAALGGVNWRCRIHLPFAASRRGARQHDRRRLNPGDPPAAPCADATDHVPTPVAPGSNRRSTPQCSRWRAPRRGRAALPHAVPARRAAQPVRRRRSLARAGGACRCAARVGGGAARVWNLARGQPRPGWQAPRRSWQRESDGTWRCLLGRLLSGTWRRR